jgi:hypothetical protein
VLPQTTGHRTFTLNGAAPAALDTMHTIGITNPGTSHRDSYKAIASNPQRILSSGRSPNSNHTYLRLPACGNPRFNKQLNTGSSRPASRSAGRIAPILVPACFRQRWLRVSGNE